MDEKETKSTENTVEATPEEKEAKKAKTEAILEIICVIFLGLTALATAWASWIGSLHGGNQATNYTSSNNVAADGNSRYNEAVQNRMNDMLVWNDIADLQIDYIVANTTEDETAKSAAAYKLFYKLHDNCAGTRMGEKIAFDDEAAMAATDIPTFIDEWINYVDENGNTPTTTSPFDDEEFDNEYYADAMAVIEESNELLEQGKKDNANGDAFGLVTVIYSVVLFLLGIIGIFKQLPCRKVILVISIIGFVVATVYMFTIPMPTGFNIASYFGG